MWFLSGTLFNQGQTVWLVLTVLHLTWCRSLSPNHGTYNLRLLYNINSCSSWKLKVQQTIHFFVSVRTFINRDFLSSKQPLIPLFDPILDLLCVKCYSGRFACNEVNVFDWAPGDSPHGPSIYLTYEPIHPPAMFRSIFRQYVRTGMAQHQRGCLLLVQGFLPAMGMKTLIHTCVNSWYILSMLCIQSNFSKNVKNRCMVVETGITNSSTLILKNILIILERNKCHESGELNKVNRKN